MPECTFSDVEAYVNVMLSGLNVVVSVTRLNCNLRDLTVETHNQFIDSQDIPSCIEGRARE